MYDTYVSFRYAVNGATLESGTTYGIGRDRPGAERRARNYAPGSAHAIWHRPDDPRIIRFDLGNKLVVFAMSGGLILMGLLFAGIGVGLLRVSGASAIDGSEESRAAPRSGA